MASELKGRRLYRFVFAHAVLCFTSGYVNASTMILVAQTTSHVTGVLTRIGWSADNGDWFRVGVDATTWIGYFVFSLVAATILGQRATKSLHQCRYRYASVFALMAVFVLVAIFGNPVEWQGAPMRPPAQYGNYVSKFFLASTMGMCNTATSVWSGGPGRTAHFSGFTTDLAIALGFSLRGRKRNKTFWYRVYFMPSGLLTFVVGAVVAGTFADRVRQYALFFPFIVYLLCATYCLYHRIIFRVVPPLGRFFLDADEFVELTKVSNGDPLPLSVQTRPESPPAADPHATPDALSASATLASSLSVAISSTPATSSTTSATTPATTSATTSSPRVTLAPAVSLALAKSATASTSSMPAMTSAAALSVTSAMASTLSTPDVSIRVDPINSTGPSVREEIDDDFWTVDDTVRSELGSDEE